MNKELQALDNLAKNVEGSNEYCFEHYKNDYEIVKSALICKEKLAAVIELLKIEQLRNEIIIFEDCSWDYDNYLKIPASKLVDRETFELLKEVFENE